MTFGRNVRRAYEVWQEMGWSALRQKVSKRLFSPGPWKAYSQDAMLFAGWMDFSPEDVARSQAVQAAHPGPLEIRSLTWFLPEFAHVYYGGIYTLLRFADYFTRRHEVQNQFVILGSIDEAEVSQRIRAAFPALAGSPVRQIRRYEQAAALPPTDAAIATLWGTAYFQLRFNQTRRKFYFLQDYEPLFYPAGSTFAQVEASYRFGYYGIANTPSIASAYRRYGGQAVSFVPCVDTHLFHPASESPNLQPSNFKPATGTSPSPPLPLSPSLLFWYGRPGHPRNGFELGAQALRLLKERLGERVRIVAAGDRWNPADYGLAGVVENLGLLEYHQTAELYRTCDAGLVMMFTRHPSYLPFELMASGALVVTNYNPDTTWFLKDWVNCRLSQVSATSFAQTLEEALLDEPERHRITATAVQTIQTHHADWEAQMESVFQSMSGPQITVPAETPAVS